MPALVDVLRNTVDVQSLHADGRLMGRITVNEKKIKRVKGGSTVPRKITSKEKAIGRSESYWQIDPRDQWAEDKQLGILDWDGK
jgi:hypothetical protein